VAKAKLSGLWVDRSEVAAVGDLDRMGKKEIESLLRVAWLERQAKARMRPTVAQNPKSMTNRQGAGGRLWQLASFRSAGNYKHGPARAAGSWPADQRHVRHDHCYSQFRRASDGFLPMAICLLADAL
jgi:hypothetical protein